MISVTMQEEFNAFLETVSDKPETRMAFLLLYWTGMRIGELLALTYDDINLEEKTISITKSYQRLKAGKGSGHQPVADLKLTAIGRKYKTVAGVLIYRA